MNDSNITRIISRDLIEHLPLVMANKLLTARRGQTRFQYGEHLGTSLWMSFGSSP